MTITTKKTSNGATIYYADGKRVAKAIAIKTAKENNINIIDTTTVDTNDNAGAKEIVYGCNNNYVKDYTEAIEMLSRVITFDSLQTYEEHLGCTIFKTFSRSDNTEVYVSESKQREIIWRFTVNTIDYNFAKSINVVVTDAYKAIKAAEDAEPPYAPANRPVQTYATKEIRNTLCYFDKATGKQITEAQAFRATIKNAFKQVTATFKQYGKITERDAQDSTVTVSVDSYEKAIDALNGVAKVFTGKAPFEWSTSKDIDGIYHVVQDGDLHEIKIYEWINSVGNLSIDIRWISYNGEEPETDAIYTINVAPVPNTPEPNDNGGN